MNVGSLFAGIGGFDLGLERAGFHMSWFCEQDEFCQHVLAEHWPGVPCYPDITELRGADVEPVDVLAGGFPCQDISHAGKGEGLAGARSGLWSEYARLVGELRPRYVLVENVSALLGRGLGVVLGDLSALGYDAEWDCIPASAVGAPHRRDRVWLVAYPNGTGPQGHGGEHELPADRGSLGAGRRSAGQGICIYCGRPTDDGTDEHEICWQRSAEEAVADTEGEPIRTGLRQGEQADLRWGRSGYGDREGHAGWTVEPDVGRVAYGVPSRVDRLRSLGNALVPQIAEWIGERVMAYEQERVS